MGISKFTRSFCALIIIIIFVWGTTVKGMRLDTERIADSYYNYEAEPRIQPNNYLHKRVPDHTKSLDSTQRSYFKNIKCIPYNFSMEDCTLCFCTDQPNLGLCWDYEPESCSQTRKQFDEQKNLPNNDPQGVW